jgi:DNA-binding response OmpR family regulator
MPPNLQVTEAGRLVTFGEWQLDTVARHLIDPEGVIVALSGAEYRLLRVFLDHPQRVDSGSAAQPDAGARRRTV